MAAPQSSDSILDAAFRRLKDSVSPADALLFQNTELKDVWDAAEEIQNSQRQRQSLQALSRIKPLLDNLERYSRVIEVLCNGTPYLPWIWVGVVPPRIDQVTNGRVGSDQVNGASKDGAPFRESSNNAQLASNYSQIFDKLLDGYSQIASAMPQFDRLRSGFSDDENFNVIMAMVYSDILEFHQRAYKLFRRKGGPFSSIDQPEGR
jgi:hypothetical protein